MISAGNTSVPPPFTISLADAIRKATMPEAPLLYGKEGTPCNLYRLGIQHGMGHLMIAVPADLIKCQEDVDRAVAMTQGWIRDLHDRCAAQDQMKLLPGQLGSLLGALPGPASPESPAPAEAAPRAEGVVSTQEPD